MTRSRDTANTQENVGGAVAPFVAGKNKIINGDFGIWQRGTTFASPSGYTADRWSMAVSTNPTTSSITQQTFTPGTAPVSGYEGTYFMRYLITTLGSSTDYYLGQKIEDVRNFAGQTATFSFWAKSDTARTIAVNYSQNFGSGGSGAVTAAVGTTYSLTTSWQRFTATVAIPSISGKTIGTSSYLQIFFTSSSALASGYQLDIWGVQLEAGSVATPFTTASGTLQGELALCQRYYYRIYSEVTAGPLIGSGQANSSTNAAMAVPHPVPMRAIPSFSISGGALTQASGSRTVGLNSSANNGMTSKYMSISAIITSAQLTAGYATQLVGFSGSTTDYLEASAEL
jgi:hypothetical protein